jgi:hypothetical protein
VIARLAYLGAALAALAACAQEAEVSRAVQSAQAATRPFTPEYLGIGTRLLDGDLVAFDVKMTGARDNNDVAQYAECAASQYALIRGYGFARHVRTAVDKRGEVWEGDATYVISDALPDGLAKIDAEVAVAACKENGIPTI